jgi:ribonucleotide reductase beta subunit family protein with ferritin-like domain
MMNNNLTFNDSLNSDKNNNSISIMNVRQFIEDIKHDKTLVENVIKELIENTSIYTVESIIDKYRNAAEDEEILNPKNKRLTIFPIKYPAIWKKYMEQLSNFWTAEEIDFSGDYDDFMLLDDKQKKLIEMVLAFFAASDGIVNFNLSERFTKEVQITEALVAYKFQEMMENIHGTIYSKMLDNIIKDDQKREHLFNAIETVESVKLMKDWAFKWIDSSKRFAFRLVAFAVIEGIFFSGAFAVIFWIKIYCNKKKEGAGKPFMEGLIKSNKFISRDEAQHVEYACELYSLLKNKLTFKEISEVIKDGVSVAQYFMTDAMPIKLIGMNNDMMNDYIEYIADRLMIMLGYKKIYNKQNPFKFMESIGLNDKTNLHEARPHEYTLASVLNKSKGREVNIKDDF